MIFLDESLKAILNSLAREPGGALHPNGQGIPLSPDRFQTILPRQGAIGYVDGGSSELLAASNLSLQKIRLAGVVFERTRKMTKKEEFDMLIQLEGNQWKVTCFPENRFSGMQIDLYDASLREGNARVKASKVGETVRRLAELDFVKRFAKSVKTDVLVLDGSLEPSFTGEIFFLDALKDLPCIGLSKTSQIITKNGLDMGSALKKEGVWWYHPVWKSDASFGTGFVRLHAKATHVFRVDFWKNQDVTQSISCLADQSQDPAFLGYPYGLIVADQLARIRQEERDFLLMRLKTEAGSAWSQIEQCVRSLNAHSVLDAIR